MSVTVTETDLEPVAQADTEVGHDEDVLAELLVEEISIDGMCGVY
jgi:mycofactocin precursor